MVFTTSVLLISGDKYKTLTTSDSGWFFGIAREIEASNGMVGEYSLSHAPDGLPISPVDQGQPLLLVMLYRGISSIDPNVGLMDVCRYWGPLLFALALIPIFLIGKELGGDLAGGSAAFFAATMTSSIYWHKFGAFDREPIQLLLGAWTIYLVIRLFKAPSNSIPIFAVLTGLVHGLFGLSWSGWWYLAVVIVGAPLFALGIRFFEKLIRGTAGPEAASKTTHEHLSTMVGVVITFAVITIILCTLGGQDLRLWEGVARAIWDYAPIVGKVILSILLIAGSGLFGYLCIEAKVKKLGAGWLVFAALCTFGIYWLWTSGVGGVSLTRYATEMRAPDSWSDITSKFYNGPGDVGILTTIIFGLIALAFLKLCWSRKRWELLAIPWLVVLAAMVWPGVGEARYERMWWLLVSILAGWGVAVLFFLTRRLSFEQFGGWLKYFQKPIVVALGVSLIATPFILNAYDVAEYTAPPTERFRGMDEGLMEAFDWLRENTPKNSVVSIQWSFGHVLTGTSERASVCDGCEILGEEGTWENEVGIIKPPDYIYFEREGRGYIYGEDVPVRLYRVNGRRIDVARFGSPIWRKGRFLGPPMDENEFEWIVGSYRDNYGCKIDYVIFSYDELASAWNYYNHTQPANILLNAERIETLQSLPNLEDQNYVFDFGENRESVLLDMQTRGNVYLRTENENLHLDGYGVLVVDETRRISYGGFCPPPTTVEIPETLLVFVDEKNNILGAWLIEAVSAEITARPIPMSVRIFQGDLEGLDYLEVVFTSSNNLIKVSRVIHENLP